MSHRPFTHPPLSVWARVAAFFSFLAVLSALVAPATMLAEEVRTGQLGGVCHFLNALPDGTSDTGDAPQAGAHCDLCGALGWTLPPTAVAAIPSFAGQQVALVDFPANLDVTIPGLPFSRGPPEHVN